MWFYDAQFDDEDLARKLQEEEEESATTMCSFT